MDFLGRTDKDHRARSAAIEVQGGVAGLPGVMEAGRR